MRVEEDKEIQHDLQIATLLPVLDHFVGLKQSRVTCDYKDH